MNFDLTAVKHAIAHSIFAYRRTMLVVFAVITALLAWSAIVGLRVDAGFAKMVPLEHRYMKTFTEYQRTFGGANRVLVAARITKSQSSSLSCSSNPPRES